MFFEMFATWPLAFACQLLTSELRKTRAALALARLCSSKCPPVHVRASAVAHHDAVALAMVAQPAATTRRCAHACIHAHTRAHTHPTKLLLSDLKRSCPEGAGRTVTEEQLTWAMECVLSRAFTGSFGANTAALAAAALAVAAGAAASASTGEPWVRRALMLIECRRSGTCNAHLHALA
jgi:hypothetical protein